MDNETAANPADGGIVTHTELAPVSNDAPQTGANTPAEGSDGDLESLAREALGEPDPNASPELVEVEYEGVKVKVDPRAKDALLRQADYTKKTMAVAEQRKALETQATEIQQRAALVQQDLRTAAQLGNVESRMAELESLAQSGRLTQEQLAQADHEYRLLQQDKGNLEQAIKQRIEQDKARESETFAQARQACLNEAKALVPNLTDERRQELEQFAISLGGRPEDVQNVVEPWAYRLLHLADVGQKFIERQRNAATMKAAGAGRPSTNVGGNAKPGGDPESMSPGEYIAWRNAGNG